LYSPIDRNKWGLSAVLNVYNGSECDIDVLDALLLPVLSFWNRFLSSYFFVNKINEIKNS